MITGRVITAKVHDAARSERPIPAKSTNADAKQGVHDAGHAGQIHHGKVDDPREPIVTGILVQVNAGQKCPRERRPEAR